MKSSRMFVIGIVIFLAIMFAVEYHLPRKFVWTPTFSHTDFQPFGCALFDSLVSLSSSDGYSVSKKTLYQLSQDTLHRKSVLIVAQHLNLIKTDIDALLQMAEKGNKIMLVATSYTPLLEDTLVFNCSYSFFRPAMLKEYVTDGAVRDSLYWVGDSAVYPPQMFRFYPHLCASHFIRFDSLPARVLAEKNKVAQLKPYDTIGTVSPENYRRYHPPVAIVRQVGEGEVILVSTPLLFTNYGMLDRNNATYLFRLLTQLKGLPMVRTEAYTGHAEVQRTPLRYFLSQPPLRWAIYLSMLAILLFLFFTARRRQRVIPVIQQPANKSLEFIKLIGTLYYQKRNHADLVHKKYIYFAEELRRSIQVDVEEIGEDERNFKRIADKTGMDVEELGRFFREVRPVIYGGRTISSEEMKYYIDKMKEIINHI